MRILVFCDEDLSAASGGDRQVIELVTHLAGRRHRIRMIAPRPSGAYRPDGVAAEDLVFVPVIRRAGMRPFSYLVGSGLALFTALVRWRPDVLLWFDAPGQFGPGICARAAGCPYVLFVNGLPGDELQGLWGWGPIRKALTGLLRHAAQGAAQVVSVCEEIPALMQTNWGIPAARCHVIRNGVDTARFRPGDAEAERERLGLDPRALYIGFVGGFFAWHGLDMLIDALPAVLREAPAAHVLLVGDGQTRPLIEARVQALGLGRHVTLAGRVPYESVPHWIAACDVCVVLHRALRSYPGDSMKLWEYMACGRPIVATEGPGYGDAVESAGCGLSVKTEDVGDLARALLRLLSDCAGRVRMGDRGRRFVETAHTWGARAESLEKVLSDACAGRPGWQWQGRAV